MRSRYTHVMRSRYARGAVEVRLWCSRGTVEVYARGAVEVRSWCGRGTLVRFLYAHRCRSGAALHFNFLSGGIYCKVGPVNLSG